jgi:threonine/homoserine/homoserine lactone efflux protein
MWLYLLQGIGYGITAASQPGPFQTYLISQTLTRGWKRTLSATLAPLISDGPIILVCLLVLSQIPYWMQRGLYIASGLFVLYLAHGAYKSWKNFDPAILHAETGTPQSVFKAAVMNLLNPNPYIFWTLVTGPILLNGWRISPLHGVIFIAGFYVTLVAVLAGIVMIFGMAQTVGPKFNHTMLAISVLALLFFGLYQLWLGMFAQIQ